MRVAYARTPSNVNKDMGPAPSGLWHPTQWVNRIGATSRLKVGVVLRACATLPAADGVCPPRCHIARTAYRDAADALTAATFRTAQIGFTLDAERVASTLQIPPPRAAR